MVTFDEVRKKYLSEVESLITAFLVQARQDTGQAMADMSLYHFETGGKRLRALIPLFFYEVFEKDGSALLPFGAAVEMIHNATLVHDDLQDGDEMRRHRPTIWKKHSAAQAINCGDAMFQYAFQLMGRLKIEPDTALMLYQRAAKATLQVIEGQAQEFIMKDETYPGVDRYISVIRGKTSGLFALPVVAALEAAGCSENLCREVEKISMDLGVLFQIQDDVLDVYGEKGRGLRASDIAEGKVSVFVAYVNEFGTDKDKSELSRILKKSRDQTTAADIQQAIAILERNDCKQRAIGYIRKIQTEIIDNQKLRTGDAQARRVHEALLSLADQFLKPIIEVI